MKLISKNVVLASLLAAASFGAFAADTVDLHLTGTIVLQACVPTLAGGGVIDYGNIPAASLAATGFTALADQASSLTITCLQPTRVAVKVVDNRTGAAPAGAITVGNQYAYGLGTVNSHNVGAYSISFQKANTTADGTSPDYIYQDNGSTSWGRLGSTDAHINAAGANKISWTTSGGNTPQAYSVISQSILVKTMLNSRTNLPALTDNVPLDGLATFTMVYL